MSEGKRDEAKNDEQSRATREGCHANTTGQATMRGVPAALLDDDEPSCCKIVENDKSTGNRSLLQQEEVFFLNALVLVGSGLD